MDFWLDDPSSIPVRVRDFYLLHSVHVGSGAHWVPGPLSPAVKRNGREAFH
jgi:hypothetical protein